MFDYHLKLHYSQTRNDGTSDTGSFDYHLKLHYSQTAEPELSELAQFDYHLKLHYSQTSNLKSQIQNMKSFHRSEPRVSHTTLAIVYEC